MDSSHCHNYNLLQAGAYRGEGGQCPGRQKVASTFFSTVHLPSTDLRFEHGGKLVSYIGRHLILVHNAPGYRETLMPS